MRGTLIFLATEDVGVLLSPKKFQKLFVPNLMLLSAVEAHCMFGLRKALSAMYQGGDPQRPLSDH